MSILAIFLVGGCAPPVTALPAPTSPRVSAPPIVTAPPPPGAGAPVTPPQSGPLEGAFVGEGTVATIVDDKSLRVAVATAPYANKNFLFRIEGSTLVQGFGALSELKIGDDVNVSFFPQRPLPDGSFTLVALRRSRT